MKLYKEILDTFIVIGNSKIFFIFVVVIFTDVILGKCRAFKDKQFNSYVGVLGLIKHILIILLVILISVCTRLLGYNGVGSYLAIFFILDYLISIYANAELLGIPLPELEPIKPEIKKKLGNKNDL